MIRPTVIIHDFTQGKGLKIDPTVWLEDYVSVVCWQGIEIGAETRVAAKVSIVDSDHYIGPDFSQTRNVAAKAPIKIGKDCWIGSNACILKGVELGDGCVVGAGAVVTNSFPAGSIVVGNPARLLRTRV